MTMKISFAPPFIDDDVKREVLDTLDSGWITTGPKVNALEQLVARYANVKCAVACNSATSGLALVLHWFGIGKGDEVIIPAYTYAATALVVIHAGAIPVMADSLDDFSIDIKDVKKKITNRTKAIIPVDIAGWPCDYAPLLELVESKVVRSQFTASSGQQSKLGRIMILSDAAHSIGATYKGQRAGRLADFTVFSFHAVKNVTTAEGGVICVNLPHDVFAHDEIYKQLRLWTLNGQTKDALAKTQGGGWRYDIVYPGFKINMPDICAAIGLAQLRKYESYILPARKKIFETYNNAFASFPWAELPPGTNGERESSCHLYPLRIKAISEQQRDQVIASLERDGVSANVHFQPLPMLSVFKNLGYNINDYPVAYDNYSREISLPIYPGLDEEKINYIVECVKRAVDAVVH